MSEDAERIKRIVAFKRKLEKRVEELESELKEQQTILETVNSILLEKGFRHAEIPTVPVTTEALPSSKEGLTIEPEPSPAQPSSTKYENVIPLKTVADELLADLYVGDDSLRIVPAEDKEFNINTPPFTQFLLEKVFVKMQEKDSELVRTGQLTPDRIFSYNIVREGDVIHEILVKHVDSDRLRELKSSIRWTLEKMYEKMKSQS